MVAALHATEFPSSELQLFIAPPASEGALSFVVLQPLQRLLAYVFKHVGPCFSRFPVMIRYQFGLLRYPGTTCRTPWP